MPASSTTPHHFPVRTPESEDLIVLSNVHPVSCKATSITAHGESQQAVETRTDNQQTFVAFVRYKPTIDRESQIWEHTRIQSEATEQFFKDYKDVFEIFAQFQAYK